MPRTGGTMGAMRRSASLVLFAFALVACSDDGGRSFARYYDPQGLFTTNLPAANDITVTPPQPATTGPGVLSGVIAAPPQPSPSSQNSLGGGFNIAQAPPTDQTIYEAFVVTTDAFPTISDMALYFLTGDPAIDVQLERQVSFDGEPGRLVVADVARGDQTSAAVAVALSLGHRGTGYVVAAIFPPGSWDHEQADFLRVLGSFRTDVPPGLGTFPVTSGAG
jgi:hypothetical protein